MNLDDLDHMQQVDTGNMLRNIDGLAGHLEAAWRHGHTLPLPSTLADVRHVVVSGMGGSAIGGDLLVAATNSTASIPITVVRGYELPAWVQGPEVLLVASSFSGNTEETLSAYAQAHSRGTLVLGVTTGGQLVQRLNADGHVAWTFPDDIGHPRAAIGWSFGLLLALASRAGWAAGLQINNAIKTMQAHQNHYRAATPAMHNPAKRLAGQLVGRFPMFIAGGIFEPVARRWKTQLNENSKMAAMFDPLPEMNHNAVVGIEFPEPVLDKLSAIFIESPQFDHPRVALRHRLTAELLLTNGIMVDRFVPEGEDEIAQIMHAVQFGDYLSYYLAIAYGADPAVIAPIKELKQALAKEESRY